MKLLTEGNQKIEKGRKLGFMTYGVHLAPSNLAGYNTCQFASAGCRMACLNTAGRGRMTAIQESRIKKTKYFFEKKQEFLEQLKKEISLAVGRAERKGLKPCFRLNLTSDIPWENVRLKSSGLSIFDSFPQVQFYDYTKSFKRALNYLQGRLPSNYQITFSRSESNQSYADMILKAGGNVAVVFRDKLPADYNGKQVIDGDETDLRFLDPSNCVVGLTEKGLAKQDESGFVVG